VAHPNDPAVATKAEHVIEVPPAAELLAPMAPLVTVVPLQLLAYHVALRWRVRRRPDPATWPRARHGVEWGRA